MDSSSNSIEQSERGIHTGADIGESSSNSSSGGSSGNDTNTGTDPQGQMFLLKLPHQTSAVCAPNNLIRFSCLVQSNLAKPRKSLYW